MKNKNYVYDCSSDKGYYYDFISIYRESNSSTFTADRVALMSGEMRGYSIKIYKSVKIFNLL